MKESHKVISVSIIMPVYNAALYLNTCIESILSQTFQDWELIAINDFSTDFSKEILEEYAKSDPRIRVFDNIEKGIIPALKLAYRYSSGLYISRMDADDVMTIDKLELLIKYSEKFPDSCITAKVEYFSDGILQDGFVRYANWLNSLVDNNDHLNSIYKECVVPSPCWMMSRSVFDSIGAFDSVMYPEDYDQCFRLYNNGVSITGIDKVLHLWRDHGARASRNDPNYLDQHFVALKMYYFKKLDRKKEKELFLWGAGKTGKLWAKALLSEEISFRWITGNSKKIGHNIYGVILEDEANFYNMKDSQIISAIKEKGFAEANNSLLQNLSQNNRLISMY